MNIRSLLLGSASFAPPSLCSMSGAADGAGGGGSSGTTPPAGDPPAGDAPKDTSVLSDAKQAEADGEKKDDQVSDADKAKEKPPADETPEAKTAREAKEKADKDTKVAASLKSYDEKLKLPDGLAKDHPIATEFLKDAAERGLSVEETQAMVTRMGPKLVEALNKPYDAWADMQKEWSTALPKDAEFGGQKYQENLGLCALAIDTIFPDAKENKAFRDMLAFTGVGNNPEMMRMIYRVGKAAKEGAPIGGKPRVDVTNPAKVLYPTMA